MAESVAAVPKTSRRTSSRGRRAPGGGGPQERLRAVRPGVSRSCAKSRGWGLPALFGVDRALSLAGPHRARPPAPKSPPRPHPRGTGPFHVAESVRAGAGFGRIGAAEVLGNGASCGRGHPWERLVLGTLVSRPHRPVAVLRSHLRARHERSQEERWASMPGPGSVGVKTPCIGAGGVLPGARSCRMAGARAEHPRIAPEAASLADHRGVPADRRTRWTIDPAGHGPSVRNEFRA